MEELPTKKAKKVHQGEERVGNQQTRKEKEAERLLRLKKQKRPKMRHDHIIRSTRRRMEAK